MLFFHFGVNISVVINVSEKTEMSKSFITGALLAVVGGFLDAYSYIIRGGVFANSQTGNIVLLGVNLAEGDFSKVFRYLVPVTAFTVGILAAEAVKAKFKYSGSIHWRQIVVFAEIILLLVFSFVPSGRGDAVVNTVISFVCALQVEAFRVISGNAIATTMCTGNLRSGTELLFLGVKEKSRALILKALTYYGIIIVFIAGAVAGALVTGLPGEKAILFCCVILTAVLAMMFKRS